MEGNPSDENLVFIDDPSETSVLYSIQQRFEKKRIYTNLGDNMVVLNPYEKYPIYDSSVVAQYQGDNSIAHIFTVARNALNSIRNGSDIENIVFCGESGAGKSFNAYKAMSFLAMQNDSKITSQQIHALETVISSFACAKTPKNDNATRLGYCADLLYKENMLSGVGIRTTTPLETIRVVSQKSGDRNFNIFYEVVHGLTQEQKSSMGIKEGQKFFYINQGKVHESYATDRQKFNKLVEALELLSFTEEQRTLIYKTIVAILHLGNLFFKEKRSLPNQPSIGVEIGNDTEIKWTSFLLEIDHSVWSESFIKKISKTEEGFSNTAYDMNQALDARDSLAQMIYEELFNWILSKITHQLKCRDATAVITVVDIYGYEKYNNNGLEQLFINSVNEKMANVFVKQSFYEPIENYIREGVHAPVENPANLDNSKVVDLLLKKPYGLLNLLDDEAKFPKGSDESYLQHCNLNHIDKTVFGKARSKDRLEFCVRHFSGTTWYTVHNFVRRNKRSVPSIVVKILSESQNSIISMIFRPIYKENIDHIIYSARQFTAATNVVADKLLNGSSRYVLCVKSNNERHPARFDLPTVSRQLKALSTPDLLQFRLRGYPIRIPFTAFTQRYRCLLLSDVVIHQKQKEIIVDILEGQGEDFLIDYKIGRNYVFLRDKLLQKLDSDREKIRKKSEVIIQKTIRAYAARKKYLKIRKASITLQAGLRGWKTRKNTAIMREEMINKLGLPSRRNKRLEAYHLGLKDPTESKDVPEATTMTDYLDVPPEANQAIERAASRVEELLETKITTHYLSNQLKKKIPLEGITMEQFAEQNYRGHLLEVRREPIITPFLHKDNDLDFRMSLEIFKLILKHMNDTKLKSTQLDELARYIVHQGIINPYQRDEIYVQICNQTYKNKDRIATERGIRLLQMCLACFPPTENIIPMLVGFLATIPLNIRTKLEDMMQKRFKVRGSQTARQLPPSLLELAAFHSYQSPVVSVNLNKDEEESVEAHSWMSTADVANRMLRQRGIGDPIGWTVEFEKDGKIISSTGNHFFHDALADLEFGIQDNKREKFLKFTTERTVPPMQKKKTSPAVEKLTDYSRSPVERRKERRSEKPMSPLAERRQRRSSGNNRSRDSGRYGDDYDSLPPLMETETRYDSSDDKYKDDDYTYTSIQKKEKPHSRSHSRNTSMVTPEPEKFKPYEVVEEKPTIVEKSPATIRAPPGFPDVKLPLPMSEPPLTTHSYGMYSNQPIIQYVPVVMQPQMMTPMGMMPGQHMMITNPTYGYQMQPTYTMDSNNTTQQTWNSSANNSLAGYAIIDNESNGSLDRRNFNRNPAPSEYSTMSIASRIRRMPVPENNRDVDKFLDEVFEQVLSPEELRNSSATPQQIAASIKGGVYGPTYEMPPASYRNPDYSRGSNDYNTMDNDRYDYIDRSNRSYDSPRSRARSLPRTDPNITQRSNGYSQIRESSVDSPPRRREAFPTISVHELKYPTSPIPPAPNAIGDYQAGYSQPTVVMMPVEIHENGQMIPIMDHHYPPISRKSFMPGQQADLTRRRFSLEHGNDAIMPTSPEPQEMRTLQRRSVTPSGSRYNSPNMRAVLQQHRPPGDLSRVPSKLNGTPRIQATPVKSPVAERKTHGLARVPLEQYADPIVQNTVSNSERPNPNKFKVPERGVAKEIENTQQEAIRKINQKLKGLPPPVDQVRVLRPKPVYVPPPAPKPQVPSYQEEQPLEITIPNEPSTLYFPVPKEPDQYVEVVEKFQPEMPQSEWVYDGDVDRPLDLQDRHKEAIFIAPYNGTNGSTKQKEEKPAVKYVKQPWKLTIRKEMFFPHEQLDNVNVIDQVFSQIIEDCRRSIAYRIRAYERDDVVSILKLNNIPPDMLNRQHEIPTSIKADVVESARRWPLYFSQIYEVVEERADESVSLLLAISEHGIRLLLHTPLDKENPLKVQDHIVYSEIVEAILENDETVCIHCRSGLSFRLRSPMAGQISEQIEKCLYGSTKRRQFVRAISDYVTTQQNLLSFQKGEIIELVGQPDGEETPEAWLYGKIGNRYGNLPSQYVVPLDNNGTEASAPPPLPLLGDDLSSSEREQHSLHGFPEDIDEFGARDSIGRYNMMEYALRHFRVPKGYDTTFRRGKKQWTWQDQALQIKWTNKCISSSLLRLESNELNKLAVDAFKCIMMYMRDESIKRGESTRDVVYRLLIICNKSDELKDEIYCQIMKQTTNNRSNKRESLQYGWRLFLILTAYNNCSLELKPYLLTYLADNAEDQRRAFHGTARVCLTNIKQTFLHGGRKCLFGVEEAEQVINGNNLRRQTYGLPGGHQRMINTRIVTVAEEIIQELCSSMNIRSSAEQQEFSLGYVTEKDGRFEYCANGDYIMDICTEMEHKNHAFHFILRRSVWVHPLRLDNPIYIDVMFFQILPDYLLGFFINMPSNSGISASMTDDIIQMAALIHIAANNGKQSTITSKTIATLIPSTVLDGRIMHNENWVDRINRRLTGFELRMSPVQARAAFLDVISRWPLFGSTKFELDSIRSDTSSLPQVDLLIGKKGISLISPKNHLVYEEYSYENIISCAVKKEIRGNMMNLTVKTQTGENCSYELHFPEATAATRLLQQYKYVVQENDGLLN